MPDRRIGRKRGTLVSGHSGLYGISSPIFKNIAQCVRLSRLRNEISWLAAVRPLYSLVYAAVVQLKDSIQTNRQLKFGPTFLLDLTKNTQVIFLCFA